LHSEQTIVGGRVRGEVVEVSLGQDAPDDIDDVGGVAGFLRKPAAPSSRPTVSPARMICTGTGNAAVRRTHSPAVEIADDEVGLGELVMAERGLSGRKADRVEASAAQQNGPVGKNVQVIVAHEYLTVAHGVGLRHSWLRAFVAGRALFSLRGPFANGVLFRNSKTTDIEDAPQMYDDLLIMQFSYDEL
jgi:hypothetical protein